jgi:hypothetical protein
MGFGLAEIVPVAVVFFVGGGGAAFLFAVSFG